MKEDLIEYVKACQEAVDNKPDLETEVAVLMGAMGVGLAINENQDVLLQVIDELKDNYSVAKYLGERAQ